MKVIDYEKTNGYFKIEYLDDKEIVDGSINIDSKSMSLDAIIPKLVIDNCENDTIIVNAKNNLLCKILSRDITIFYKEVTEYDFFESFNIYNEKIKVIDDEEFVNVQECSHSNHDQIIFQFYYKNIEKEVCGTPSYIINNVFSKGARISDKNSPHRYYSEFDTLCRAFKTNFFTKNNLNIDDYLLCCIPRCNKYKLNPLKDIIKEITKRNVLADGRDIIDCNGVSEKEKIKERNIILVSDIVSDSHKMKSLKELLIKNGAKSVIMYAFSKASKVIKEDNYEL